MKRKWEDPKPENKKSAVDIELHLETPLPLEWERCLDIQSGKVHFYNTKTHKRTSKDPRRSSEPPNSNHGIGDDLLTLDLELNLNCQSKNSKEINRRSKKIDVGDFPTGELLRSGKLGSGLIHSPAPWLTLDERDRQEMVAGVCMQCHLLVMLLKSSPICPNCKFMQNPPTLFMASHASKDQSQSLKGFSNLIQNKV